MNRLQCAIIVEKKKRVVVGQLMDNTYRGWKISRNDSMMKLMKDVRKKFIK